jgi:ribosomal protein L11 methylase PrmA
VLRARFLELAPDGFEEAEHGVQVELAAYGEAATRVLGAFPDAVVSDVEAGWEERWREFHRPVRVGPLWIGPPWEVPDGNAIALDEAAIEATKTNAAANGVEVDARRLDASEGPLPRADLALANIALGPVEALGGRLEVEHAITSGYLAADEPQLGSLRHTGRRELDGWAADLFERR